MSRATPSTSPACCTTSASSSCPRSSARRLRCAAREFPAGAERVLAERERFGIDHAQCGALLAERWGLPAEVASIIAWHHGGPTGVGAPNADIACVQLADNVAGMLVGIEADHALLEVSLAA